ncbi:zinc finger MYM-type protein 1-like [Pelobates fuscus]|uniref:zinc finger MYM-type protein 1-like n=1 Tax=Pelobates fuscus TaxID=191477 RepID=UPI002FE435A7
MKRNRPSGSQQRKIKKAREKSAEAMSGSILKYLAPSTSTAVGESAEDVQSVESRGEMPEVSSQEASHVKAQELEKIILSSSGESDVDEGDSSRSLHQQDSDDDDEEEETVRLSVYSDVAAWPVPVPDVLRVDLIKRGSEPFQNRDGPFSPVERQGEKSKGKSRQLTTAWFYKALPNGEKILRTWMVYSPSKQSLFCFCCRLFAVDDKVTGASSFVTGFQLWWKLNPKVSDHEASEQHLTCLEKWKTLRAGLKLQKCIDHVHQTTVGREKRKWRDILHRLLDVTLFLAHQNLPFRGHRETMSSANKGNFLELVELLSNYDPILKEHFMRLKHAVASGKRMTSYFSPKIQNELICLLGNHVKDKIVADIKKAKYFGILFDSTPDVSHTDQICEVIRYVHIEGDHVEVKESFLGFFPVAEKTAAELTENILQHLEEDGLDLSLCRGQGYDNAATMAGIHGELNPKALFMPCANHSLNLCGVHLFGSVASCVTFLGTLERVYSFFSVSTHRWEVLMENLGVTVKRLSQTRWSAHYDAVKPVRANFEKLTSALEKLCNPKENVDTRGSAQMLLSAVCDFSFLCYLSFWCEVLEEVNITQKYLQTVGLTLEKCIVKLQGLKAFLADQCSEIVEKAICYATTTCKEMDISMERRGRVKLRKTMPGEKAKDAGLTLPEEMKRAMFECPDRFHHESEIRSQAIEKILSMFAVIQPNSLVVATEKDIRNYTPKLTEIFDEFSDEDIFREIERLQRHLEAAKISVEEAKKWTALQFLEFIVKWDYCESLPNLSPCLRFFLTLCVSIASCERSFSKLKLIKNLFRSTMSETRLTNLAILSIEHEYARKIGFDEVIDKFAEMKARRQRM